MRNFLQKFRRDEDGAAMVEYAVLIGLITAGVVTVINTMGGNIKTIFTTVQGYLATAAG